jgi:hypothetical protein
MRAARHHQRQVAFEQLESRSMLSVSPFHSAPSAAHGHALIAAVVAGSTKSSSARGAATMGVAKTAIATPAVVTPQAGDLNFDGKINAADISDMMLALTNRQAYEEKYDVSDETVNLVADVNGDGQVNIFDFQRLLHVIADQPPPPPPPPPPTITIPVTPTEQPTVEALVAPANNTSTTTIRVVTAAVAIAPANIFVPAQSTVAILAGGGGDAQAPATTVTNNGPPMPTPARTSDASLIAFASDAGGGGDQLIQGMLLNLADVEEPQMLAIEYGDDVVKHEVVNKAVVPAVAEQPALTDQAGADQATANPIAKEHTGTEKPAISAAPQIVAETVTPAAVHGSGFFAQSFWWLVAIPAGALAGLAAWWIYRQRLFGNVGTLLRRLGL